MVFGIDEVGRGCWAGPLVVAAVGLGDLIDGLADSKKLSALRRQKLLLEINTDNNIVLIEAIESKTVDELGLTKSLELACEKLFSSISKHSYDKVIIDGNINYLANQPRTEAVVKADASLAECMAAGIAAKEWRDSYMRELAKAHPEYGFELHVGYGTQIHKQAIMDNGLIEEHRRSFKPIQLYETGKWS